MKRIVLILSSIFILFYSVQGQEEQKEELRILFKGLVIDASTFSPVSNSQIMINNSFSTVSALNGSFSFYVNKHDTVIFRSLGYKDAVMPVSDTLFGKEYITGIYLNSDTLAIPEVIILPEYSNIKSEILKEKKEEPTAMDNARYNVAIGVYQARKSQNVMGDPQVNYSVINQRQKLAAFEKGGIPAEHIVGISPLILLPAAYYFLHGLPENAPPLNTPLTDEEVAEVHRRYMELHNKDR